MVLLMRLVVCALLIGLLSDSSAAQKNKRSLEVSKSYRPAVVTNSTELQIMLDGAVRETLTALAAKGFRPEDIAATLIDLRDPTNLKMAQVRGHERIYPASVVKMFYMAALQTQLESGGAVSTPELTRGLRDMIIDSSNEATQYIFDVLTGTASGAEMPDKEFQEWQFKRNAVNRYFTAMGYENINVNQKTFCEDAYGIEQQSRGYKGQNRNMLTTNATARLLAEIVLGRVATPERTRQMMDLMKRDPFAPATDPDNQANGFTGKALITRKMTDARLWSKAGWTSKTRHDAAHIETADGLKFVIVVFTENHANEKEPIPMIAGKIIDRLNTTGAQASRLPRSESTAKLANNRERIPSDSSRASDTPSTPVLLPLKRHTQ